MDGLPADLCLKIFCFLDQQGLAASQRVCRKWKALTSDNTLWSNLFEKRWGEDCATFYSPEGSKSWKEVYEVQDRCDRIGLGLKIIREGCDYYLVHQGEIQRYLGSKKQRKSRGRRRSQWESSRGELVEDEGSVTEEEEGGGSGSIIDKILFFIGDLEMASGDSKRSRCQ